jgi:hypothetical protein
MCPTFSPRRWDIMLHQNNMIQSPTDEVSYPTWKETSATTRTYIPIWIIITSMFVAKSKHKSTEIKPIILKSIYDIHFFPHVNTFCFTRCTSENLYSYVSCKVTPLIQTWKRKVTHTSHICHSKNTYFGQDTNPQHCIESYRSIRFCKNTTQKYLYKMSHMITHQDWCYYIKNEIHRNIQQSHEIKWNSSFTLNWNWYIFWTYGIY